MDMVELNPLEEQQEQMDMLAVSSMAVVPRELIMELLEMALHTPVALAVMDLRQALLVVLAAVAAATMVAVALATMLPAAAAVALMWMLP